jgi:hypothetical protein
MTLDETQALMAARVSKTALQRGYALDYETSRLIAMAAMDEMSALVDDGDPGMLRYLDAIISAGALIRRRAQWAHEPNMSRPEES